MQNFIIINIKIFLGKISLLWGVLYDIILYDTKLYKKCKYTHIIKICIDTTHKFVLFLTRLQRIIWVFICIPFIYKKCINLQTSVKNPTKNVPKSKLEPRFCFQFFTQFDELRSRFLIYLAKTQARLPSLLIDVSFPATLNYSAISN